MIRKWMVVQSVYGPEVFPCSLKMKGVVHNHDMNKSDVVRWLNENGFTRYILYLSIYLTMKLFARHILVKKLNIAPITFPINQKQITMKYFIPSPPPTESYINRKYWMQTICITTYIRERMEFHAWKQLFNFRRHLSFRMEI